MELVTRAKAKLIRVIDGDTYVLLIDWKQNNFQHDAETDHYRLADHSCREKGTPLGDQAITAVLEVLGSAKVIVVQMKGKDTLGRELAWIWFDDTALGPYLEAKGLADRSKHEGLSE